MGRPAKGWQLRKKRGRPYCVRFSVGGKQVELGTGELDADRAAARAAELYADAIRGARRKPRRASSGGQALTEIASRWLTSIAPTIEAKTRSTYALYAETHWAKRWPTIEAMTDATIAEHVRDRLRHVQAPTVRKENSALRGMLAWAEEQGLIAEAPKVPSIPKRALGKVHKLARKGPPVEVSPEEARAILQHLPVRDRRLGIPVRSFFVVLYETGLRASTIARLSVPEHWRPGSKELNIPKSIDKSRNGRPVPLTGAAVRALTSVAPANGLIFGEHDLRVSLRNAAAEVLDANRAERISQGHWRHNRLTHWTETTGNLPGVQYLAGHKHVSTTARYVKPSLRAARDVLVLGAKRRRP